MQIEIVIAVVILLTLIFFATIDTAFTHLSDVSLRRLAADAESARKINSAKFLREILENRPRFRFALSSTIQILLITFTVLLTLIVFHFTENRNALLFFALAIGLAATMALRQVLPRLLIRNNTERKLLFLLPAVKPIYMVASAIVSPFASRSTAKESQKLEQSLSPDSSEDRSDDGD
jgi:CBS domain containing-hemolysin-like protein